MEATGSHPTKEEGLRLIKEGNYLQAVSVLDHVVETDPSDAQAFLYLGVAYAEMGNKAEAIASFEQSVSVKPSARAHFNLGLAYESVERLGEAMTQYQYATRLDNAYKPALDAIERLKSQGVEPAESTAQWTIGAQSVADAISEAQTRQAEQTTALPPGFAPGAPGTPGGPPRQYLPGEYEAIQEAKIRESQAEMTKAGLKYGALLGPFVLMTGMMARWFIFPVGAFFPNLIFVVFGGAIGGGIIGAVCGHTGGDEDTGKWVGALVFGLLTLLMGLVQGYNIMVPVVAVLNGFLGFFAGLYIGRLVSASIGWD